MCDGVHDLLEIHSCALNGKALETLEPWWRADTACFCDGQLVGEGRQAIRQALSEEFHDALLTRVVDMGGSPAIVAFEGPEGRGAARVVLRLEAGNQVHTCRIERLVAP